MIAVGSLTVYTSGAGAVFGIAWISRALARADFCALALTSPLVPPFSIWAAVPLSAVLEGLSSPVVSTATSSFGPALISLILNL